MENERMCEIIFQNSGLLYGLGRKGSIWVKENLAFFNWLILHHYTCQGHFLLLDIVLQNHQESRQNHQVLSLMFILAFLLVGTSAELRFIVVTKETLATTRDLSHYKSWRANGIIHHWQPVPDLPKMNQPRKPKKERRRYYLQFLSLHPDFT